MSKLFLASGTALAGLAVILGAFAAHGLKAKLSETLLATFQTGVHYQMIHALALLLIGVLWLHQFEQRWLLIAGIAMLAGIALFSGSLYWLALGGSKQFGIITPIGGVGFIIGWAALFVAVVKH